MSALDDLKDRIDSAIYTNTEQNITGDGLQTVLDDMVDTMGVSVSQNTETGHTDINIGGVAYPVASVNDVQRTQDRFDKCLIKGSEVTPSGTFNDKFINKYYGGYLTDFSGYSVKYYAVNAGKIYIGKLFSNSDGGVSVASYAFYNSSTFTDATCVKLVANLDEVSNKDFYPILVPEGATYLAISCSSNEALFNPTPVDEEFTDIKDDIDSINDEVNSFIIYNYSQLSIGTTYEGFYINSAGGFNEGGSSDWKVYEYEVTQGQRLRITNTLNAGIAVIYAFYSGQEASGVISIGPTAGDSHPDVTEIIVPSGANYLCVTRYEPYTASVEESIGEISNQSFYDVVKEYIGSHNIKDYTHWRNVLAYARDGENLYVAYNDGNGKEMCYWFRKCMANNLYTFYRVGYRSVIDRIYPSADGIGSGSGITIINDTYSDNIGPILYTSTAGVGGSGFVGGNHHYPSEDVTPKYNTAANESFHLYADGNEISDGKNGLCTDLVVNVKNVIFDPGYAPAEGATSLSTPLCYEYVTYAVRKNNIEVALKLEFVNGAQGTIDTYYGMQSMFASEDYILTPNGLQTDWSAVADGSFTKSAYPNFNRFIEKNSSNGYYQSTYLLPDFSAGKHSGIGDADSIYIHSGGKSYHHLFNNITISGASTKQWAGVYTFFDSANLVIDDASLLVYRGVIRGKDVLFINSKQAFAGAIPVPKDLALKKVSVIENYGFTDEDNGFNIGGDGIYAESTSTGSLILQFD